MQTVGLVASILAHEIAHLVALDLRRSQLDTSDSKLKYGLIFVAQMGEHLVSAESTISGSVTWG
jgi:predicted Zn-dependent protease